MGVGTHRAVALSMTRLKVLRQRLPRHEMYVARPLPTAKHTNPFYSRPEFRRWRAQVLQRARRRCEWVLDNGAVCGVSNPKMYADHIVELSDGGAEFDPSNGQCLCASHHTFKTNLVKKGRVAWSKWRQGVSED